MMRCTAETYSPRWYDHPLTLSVTEDGLTAETGLTIKILLWNWHIVCKFVLSW